jgi:hypothetical protein
MSDVPRILSQIEDGDSKAAEELLPLAYEELRKLATAKMAQKSPGQTLQATAHTAECAVMCHAIRILQATPSCGPKTGEMLVFDIGGF